MSAIYAICVQKYIFLAFKAKKEWFYLQVRQIVSNFAPQIEERVLKLLDFSTLKL